MAERTRKSAFSNVEMTWDDSGLQDFFRAMQPKAQTKTYQAAIKKTLESVQKLTISAAKAQGFGQTGPASNNGWDWERRGRLPRAITVGKIWAKTGQAGGRIYTKTAKDAGENNRSPMANAFITGYDQHVPTGLPGKGQTRVSKRQPARPVYKLVEPLVRRIFVDNTQRAITYKIRRRSKT